MALRRRDLDEPLSPDGGIGLGLAGLGVAAVLRGGSRHRRGDDDGPHRP
ncbi:hypothetical protein [Isoptericola sp. NPDC019571]